MKLKTRNFLALTLALALQVMPLLRSVLPTILSPGSQTGALILRWAAGGVAYFGYHAVSSASSIAISPPSATLGVPYAGSVTYSGGHAGSVESMSISNHCLGSFILAPGLTLTYNGGHTASLTGTPTGAIGTFPFTMTMWDLGSCTGSLTDTRSTSLIIQNSGGGPVAPSIVVAPQSVVAQVGSDVILSGGASGNPAPAYFWKQGLNLIPGATNNTLLIPAVQLTNAGIYTLFASNSTGTANSACDLTVAITPGSNILAFQYTNYIVSGTSLTMSSLLTNVPSATNTYAWSYNDSLITGATTNTLNLSTSQTVPSKSGIYTISFTSKVGGSTIVNDQPYDSYWVFGFLPSVTTQPTNQTVAIGANATFSMTLTGSTYPDVFLYQNQTNLMGETNLSGYNPSTDTSTTNIALTIANITQANAGQYTFVVTNFWGSTTSSVATLTVPPPFSVTAPQSQTNYAGKNVSLTVSPVGGTAPFSYQWQEGTANLANGGNISGATTNTLTFSPAATTNSGNYQMVVTNNSGSVTSSVAAVSIVPVPQPDISFVTANATLSAADGIPGSQYIVQMSTNLANASGWAPIQTNVVPSNGIIMFTDTNSSNTGQRFYRVQFP